MNVFDIEGNAVETPSVKYQYFAAVVGKVDRNILKLVMLIKFETSQ